MLLMNQLPVFIKGVFRICKSIRLFYGDLKIKNKLFVLHLMIVLAVFAACLAALQVAFKTYDDQLYSEAAQVLNLSTSGIESDLKRIEKMSYNIISDSKVQEYVGVIKNSELPFERNEKMGLLITTLSSYANSENNVSSIHFISTEGEQYRISTAAFDIDDGIKDSLVQRARMQEGANVIFVPGNEDKSVFVARAILATPGLSLDYMGTVIIRFNINKVIQQYMASSPKSSSQLIILADGKTLYSSRPLADLDNSLFVLSDSTGYAVREVKGEKLLITHHVSAYSGWDYISAIQYEQIFNRIIFMRSMIILLFLMISILTVLISMRFARNLTRPLELLTLKMKQVERGDFEIHGEDIAEYPRRDEIGQLHKDFGIMIQKIDTLIKDDFIKKIIIKDAQIKALQAQINPHFLYNTLESINWMAKLNHQKNISLMVESLGNLLRAAISNKERVVSLEEELKLLESYVTIQKIRYEERLDFCLNVGENLQKFSIPKLTLQPIVENSIKYGLENMIGTCKICVKAFEKEDVLELVIEDNGPGIPPDILERLKSGEIMPKGLGIGLRNIDDRIKMIFGDKYGIEVESTPGQGTRVGVLLPNEMGMGNV